jgi:hypothetical protein
MQLPLRCQPEVPTMKSVQPIVAAMACCLLMAAVELVEAQTYYKWTDENGTTHFTAEPPVDRDYESIDTSGNVISTTRLEPPAMPSADQQATGAESQTPREAEPDPEVVEARCNEARERLFWLQSNRRIVVEDDQGNEQFIDAERQQALIEENRALLEEWCGGVDGSRG